MLRTQIPVCDTYIEAWVMTLPDKPSACHQGIGKHATKKSYGQILRQSGWLLAVGHVRFANQSSFSSITSGEPE